jgi:hypothetical protein
MRRLLYYQRRVCFSFKKSRILKEKRQKNNKRGRETSGRLFVLLQPPPPPPLQDLASDLICHVASNTPSECVLISAERAARAAGVGSAVDPRVSATLRSVATAAMPLWVSASTATAAAARAGEAEEADE